MRRTTWPKRSRSRLLIGSSRFSNARRFKKKSGGLTAFGTSAGLRRAETSVRRPGGYCPTTDLETDQITNVLGRMPFGSVAGDGTGVVALCEAFAGLVPDQAVVMVGG